ncbi:FAD-dependent oxidoreductase [Sorangium sp. So ce1151]|uniref:FAD-dependent oxidoreductase n=1 Tax=Sorangium sp. So ce1151 TaxID=3133332 RepID=UPI003F5F24F8
MRELAKKRVCVVGAGAAGLAAAWSLSRSGRFEVSVQEEAELVGGVASTVSIALPTAGITRMNDQVRCGAPTFRNTELLFEAFGSSFTSMPLRVSIGTGEARWNNTQATPFILRMRPEIRRFRRLLELIRRAPARLGVALPIESVLRVGRFSEDFRHRTLYPLMSLFFASGVDSMRVPATVVAALFLDEDSRLFDFDAGTLLPPFATVVVFPDLAEVYARVAAALGGCVHTGASVTSVARSARGVSVKRHGSAPEAFDAVIFACSAERALGALADPSPIERLVLGSVEYQEAVLVTHVDADYIRRHHGVAPDSDVQYYTRNDPSDPARIEVSMHLGRFQPWLRGEGPDVFQTIEPIGAISADKILLTRRARHPRNSTRHFLRMLPWLRFIQGRRRTCFAGGYTLMNTHEHAVVSGLAAAERLGAPYPFADDPAARAQFELYRRAVHG